MILLRPGQSKNRYSIKLIHISNKRGVIDYGIQKYESV